ncbi:hypothetical protein [Ligilactobacillus agilis]|uniref:hypothetical protein n=1 Tax=Ligilactobacillus agilis TaxID=1601 RepID=UPI00195A155E|nr:hypothetical protein [Ligilactobacillus agilis]MBM6764025.1 hypothetical protein [Ligilactobacillus agilis]
MKKRYIFFGIIGILISIVISPLSIIGVAIFLLLCLFLGLFLPAMILHDKEEIDYNEKYISDPINAFKKILLIVFIVSILLATLCTIIVVFSTSLHIKYFN